MKNLDLENEKISKLIKKFSIPCVISLLIASLYNIVDQIFIGWSKAGTAGNAATNIVFPFTVIALAFALLVSDGSATLFNISLGAKDKEKANKSIGNGLTILIFISIILTILGLIFNKQIINIFGGNKNEIECYNYAKDYFRIFCYGLPFYIIGQGFNNIIRCDGSPKYAMLATITGAITNIILDPIFIFYLNLGIKGAALATIIGQILTFTITMSYLKKTKQFKITKKSMKLDLNICKRMTILGISSMITQLTMVITIAVTNKIISKYGYLTIASTNKAYGIVTPLAVIGICMKVFGIIISIIVGVSLGAMPIIGYNIGAGNTKRVKETVKKVILINMIIGFISFILFQFFPTYIINIFGTGNSIEYLEYAKYCFRIFLGGIVLICIIKTSSICLQSMGSGIKSTILALSRDILFSVPLFIIISNISKSVVTMMWAALISDVLAFILTIVLLKLEFKKLDKKATSLSLTDELLNTKPLLNEKIIITISREYASGGRYVGKLLSEKLGIKLYDKEIINLTAKEYGYSTEYINEKEEQSARLAYFYSNDDKLFEKESRIIEKIAKKESCIIVGRCADYVLRKEKNITKIFLYSDMESKINRAVKYYGIKKNNAKKEIMKINNQRKKHYNTFTNGDWYSLENYDLAFNVDKLGVEKTAEAIKNIIVEKYKK